MKKNKNESIKYTAKPVTPIVQERKEKGKQTRQKIYRNTENKLLGGVCSGLGDYYNIDPVIVRLIFVAASFFKGIGIIAYLVLWLIFPDIKKQLKRV